MEKGFHISGVRGRSPTFDVPFARRFPWRVSERISSDRRDPRRLPRESLGQEELFFTRMSAWKSLDTRYPPGTCFSRSSADAAEGRAGPGAAGTEVSGGVDIDRFDNLRALRAREGTRHFTLQIPNLFLKIMFKTNGKNK
nr:uncharacterized protein LOC102134891 isoform X1 [Macaca fascicularis]